MDKTFKTVPQKEKTSSSSWPARGRTVVPPRIEECIPEPYEITSDFKIDKPASIPDRCEPMSRYIFLITKDELEQEKKIAIGRIRTLRSPPPKRTLPPISPRPYSLVKYSLYQEENPKPTMENKRKRGSPATSSKPKKSKARKPMADSVAQSLETTQRLRDEDKEREDDNCLLVARKRGSTNASKSTEPMVEDAKEEEVRDLRVELENVRQEQTKLIVKAQQKGELVEQLREELKMKEAETLGWKHYMDCLASEKYTFQEQLTSIECQLQNAKEESLSWSLKIKELEAKSADELAKAKSESWRETLEEVHSLGFDISADIEKAKTLEEEVVALLSDDEDSASVSESGGDEDEVPEEEVPEDAAREEEVLEDVDSKDVVPGAFDKLKSELLCREAMLRKVVDGEKSLRLLFDEREDELEHLRCETSQSLNYESYLEEQKKTRDLECLRIVVGQAKREHDELKARADAHTIAERGALAKASALEIQLRLASENSLVRMYMVTKLESELLKIKAEVVDARAEAVMSRTKADKKVAVYLKDVADARAELRRALDRESRSKEYAWYKSRRETHEEIHARGFDLLEEVKKAKADEHDARSLLSNAEDSENEADRP
ncbi:uncharacterized protein [Nicotiana sylvestris]|uniref:uncharacterized protein n=1 Tax=Nicotiana sylvestris TaxID=4096 RepID=UPI00388CECEB